MKRLNQLLAGTIMALLLVPVVATAPASAASTCDIGFTGPDSNNLCTSVETYNCTVTNTNTVEITNSNNQVVGSGPVSNSGNTTGGSGTSGSVANTNGGNFSVTIVNANPDTQEAGVCTAAVVVPANETPETVTPTQPNAPTPTALPITSSGSALTTIMLIAGSAVVAALLSIAALLLYRRSHAA